MGGRSGVRPGHLQEITRPTQSTDIRTDARTDNRTGINTDSSTGVSTGVRTGVRTDMGGSNLLGVLSVGNSAKATNIIRSESRIGVKNGIQDVSSSQNDRTASKSVSSKNQSSSQREIEMNNDKRKLLMAPLSFAPDNQTLTQSQNQTQSQFKSNSTSNSQKNTNLSQTDTQNENKNMKYNGSNSQSTDKEIKNTKNSSSNVNRKQEFETSFSSFDENSQVDQESDNRASQPSKRAKMMLNAVKNPVINIVKKDIKTLFDNNLLGSMKIIKKKDSGTENDAKKTTNSMNTVKKKYDCLVCKSVALVPCGAKCGHICCESCWVRWLKVKESCPLCRAPTLLAQIKKITII